MMNRFAFGIVLISVVLLTSCAHEGEANLQVFGITSPVQACVSTPMLLEGLNFLSEHGATVTIRFEASQGTPFEGGTEIDAAAIHSHWVRGAAARRAWTLPRTVTACV